MQENEEKEELLKVVNTLTLMDDTFFHVFAEDVLAVQEMLRVLMQDDELEVIETHPQDSLKNLAGRSVILDVLVRLKDNRLCNVEIQKLDNDDHQCRARYNGSCVTTAYSKSGEKFFQIPDVAVIYITKFDFFKKNLPIYHIERVIAETGEVVYNGLEEIYVNTAVNDGSTVAKLMQGFKDADCIAEEFSEVARRCTEIQAKDGENMCEKVEAYAQKYAQKIAKKAVEENLTAPTGKPVGF